MAVVAPTTAVCAVAIPVVVSVLLGERPGPLAVDRHRARDRIDRAGQPAERRGGNRIPAPGPIGRATVRRRYRAGFGRRHRLLSLTLARTGAEAGMWPILVSRGGLGDAFHHRGVVAPDLASDAGPDSRLAIVCGVMDMLANALYLLAGRVGPLSIVVTLSSLYPASTVLLARVVLGERLNLLQISGVGCALAAVVADSWGGLALAQYATDW